jgi:putative transposase
MLVLRCRALLSFCLTSHQMSKDYERKVQTSETVIELTMIRLLVARLGHRS